MKLCERAARLLGLDAPVKIQASLGAAWAPLASALDNLTAAELLVLRKYQSQRVLGLPAEAPNNVLVGEVVKREG